MLRKIADAIFSPMGSLISSGVATGAQMLSARKARKANEKLRDEILAGYEGLQRQATGGYNDLIRAAQQGYGQIMGYGLEPGYYQTAISGGGEQGVQGAKPGTINPVRNGTPGINNGAPPTPIDSMNKAVGEIATLRDRLMGYEDQYRNQAKSDINKSYDRALARNQSSLVSRGLSNTTVGQNMAAGVDRERADALARLADSNLRTRAGFDANATGSLANAYGALASGQANIQQSAMNSLQNLGLAKLAAETQIPLSQLQFMNTITNSYPESSYLSNLTNQISRQSAINQMPPPTESSSWGSITSALGSVGGAAIGGAVGGPAGASVGAGVGGNAGNAFGSLF